MKSRIKIMKWIFITVLFLSMVLSYKPQNIIVPGENKDKIEKVPIPEKVEVIVKKKR